MDMAMWDQMLEQAEISSEGSDEQSGDEVSLAAHPRASGVSG